MTELAQPRTAEGGLTTGGAELEALLVSDAFGGSRAVDLLRLIYEKTDPATNRLTHPDGMDWISGLPRRDPDLDNHGFAPPEEPESDGVEATSKLPVSGAQVAFTLNVPDLKPGDRTWGRLEPRRATTFNAASANRDIRVAVARNLPTRSAHTVNITERVRQGTTAEEAIYFEGLRSRIYVDEIARVIEANAGQSGLALFDVFRAYSYYPDVQYTEVTVTERDDDTRETMSQSVMTSFEMKGETRLGSGERITVKLRSIEFRDTSGPVTGVELEMAYEVDLPTGDKSPQLRLMVQSQIDQPGVDKIGYYPTRTLSEVEIVNGVLLPDIPGSVRLFMKGASAKVDSARGTRLREMHAQGEAATS